MLRRALELNGEWGECSCQLNVNLDYLVEKIWDYLRLLRIYTKKRGQFPDFSEPVILRNGASIEHVVRE
jgi:uncharacterized protein